MNLSSKRTIKHFLSKKNNKVFLLISLWYIFYLVFIFYYDPIPAIYSVLALIFPIIILGMINGLKGGIISSIVSSAVIFVKFFYNEDVILSQEIIPIAITFLVIGFITGLLSNNLRYHNKRLALLYESLRETQSKYEFLYNLIKITSSILDPIELSEKLIELLNISFGYSTISILLVDEEHEHLEIVADQNRPGIISKKIKLGEGITGIAAQDGKTIYVPDVSKDKRYIMGSEKTKSELAVPIKHKGNVLGILNLESPEYSAFSNTDIEYMELFADQISISMANARLMSTTWQQAITDELTSLYNYRYFINILEREVYEAERYNKSLTVLIIDLDDLKIVNDTFGHPIGDQLLKSVAKIISASVRKSDIVARYGGDEFGVILPGTDKEGGLTVANKIRENIKAIHLDMENIKNRLLLTASIGIASFPDDANNWEKLVVEADKAMYIAKEEGKDMVVCK